MAQSTISDILCRQVYSHGETGAAAAAENGDTDPTLRTKLLRQGQVERVDFGGTDEHGSRGGSRNDQVDPESPSLVSAALGECTADDGAEHAAGSSYGDDARELNGTFLVSGGVNAMYVGPPE
ncbi:MAG: hypothetical protein LQ338_005312 [Usnochroma carphineum]|nr:MAG: hypothetical protein LQ338_005312 [Usnochroma carphineum]